MSIEEIVAKLALLAQGWEGWVVEGYVEVKSHVMALCVLNPVESCLTSTHKAGGKCRQCEPCKTFLNAKDVHIIPGISSIHSSKFDGCRLFYEFLFILLGTI